jgi:hypothetical protein
MPASKSRKLEWAMKRSGLRQFTRARLGSWIRMWPCLRRSGHSEERSKDRRNLPDNGPQAEAFGLQSGVEEIVVIRHSTQHTIHLRQPAFTEPFGIGVSHVEPVPEQTLPLQRVSPKTAAVLQTRLILIKKSSHCPRSAACHSKAADPMSVIDAGSPKSCPHSSSQSTTCCGLESSRRGMTIVPLHPREPMGIRKPVSPNLVLSATAAGMSMIANTLDHADEQSHDCSRRSSGR